MQKITPYLWYDNQAEDAANFYISVFKENSKVLSTMPGGPDGKPMVVEFELRGQRFIALNGGPQYQFNEAVSFAIDCKDQDEVDYYWNTLTADGGEESSCGWLKDKFGLSWQVVPSELPSLLSSPKAVDAMLKMKKLDIAELKRAGEQ